MCVEKISKEKEIYYLITKKQKKPKYLKTKTNKQEGNK